MKKKTKKAATKSQKKTMHKAGSRKTAKAAKRAVKRTKAANRRKHRRFAPKALWVTERNGDYQYTVPAKDISEGGVFLAGRLKTSNPISQLTIRLGDLGSVQLAARQVHDLVDNGSCGTGYQFTDVSQAQAKLLRGYCRNLD